MRTAKALAVTVSLFLALACSPRDFLTRRLATDLISASEAFRAPQVFYLRTGVISNKDFSAPDSLVLQRRGWIIGNPAPCPVGVEPPPCWDVLLSPHGVEVFRPLMPNPTPGASLVEIRLARRQLLEITGISRADNNAEVEFTWHWVALNEVGTALYDNGVRYRSTVAFRKYDDGWRVTTEAVHGNQTLDEALHNAQPAP